MFKFLKEKLKGAIEKFTKKVEEEAPAQEEAVEEKPEPEIKPKKKETPKKAKQKKEALEEPVVEKEEIKPADIPEVKEEKKEEILEQPKEEKQGFFKKLFGPKKKEELPKETVKLEIDEETLEIKAKELPQEKPEEEKTGFFGKLKEKLVTKVISESKFEELFFDLEVVLLENNVAFDVVEKIKAELKENIVDKPIPRSEFGEVIISTLRKSIEGLFENETFDLMERIKSKKPYVIVFVGINGSGKTTTIAKFANMLKEKGLSVVLAAADTFRAAAIQQLEKHADKLNVKIIKHNYGSDPAAVAFDAIDHAKAKNIDVVLIDTAGRMHSNENLIKEMEKIMRVAKPDMKIFVGESTTGNGCVEQAREFNQSINFDGIILSKADIDEKGGAAVSVSYITKKPILFLGTGQEYKDMEPFDKLKIIKSIGL